MKKLLIVSLLVLAGCKTETIVREVPASSSTTTIYQPPAPVYNPTTMDYNAYLAFVNSYSTGALLISDYDLITYGDNVCTTLFSGSSVQDVVEYLSSTPMSYSESSLVASVVSGAITYLCPEFLNEMNFYLENGGV